MNYHARISRKDLWVIDTLQYSISKYEAVNFLFLELSEISFFPDV